MMYLLKLEWLKIKRNKIFLVSILGFTILLPVIIRSLYVILPEIAREMGEEYVYLPGSAQSITWLSSWLVYFLFSFLAITLVTSEYSNKTLRQGIISGISRNNFLSSKLLTLLALSIFIGLYTFIIALIADFFISPGTNQPIFSKAYFFLTLSLQAFGFMSIAFFLGLLFRRAGYAFFVFFPYPLVEFFTRLQLHQDGFYTEQLNSYYPMKILNNLTVVPGLDKADNIKNTLFAYLPMSSAIVIALIYIAIFWALAYFIFSRRDL